MTKFYAKSTSGFYDDSIHVARTLTVIDPSWSRPTINVPDPNWVAPSDDPQATAPLIDEPDMSVEPPTVTVPNPNCQIPADAVEITAEQHAELLAAQSAGKIITADADGNPIATDPPPPSLDDLRAAALTRINTGCEKAMEMLRANYPDSEVMSWSQQTREADALDANPNATTPLLTAIATVRGLSIADLAARVRAKTAAYAVASGQIIGQRQALEDALGGIDLKADDAAAKLEAIQWPAA
ncbi:hypothetical protein [Laribacter hongkongensis]|uniref:hypothetical protein n=1 Tax=Laribacter hongkongensis TaxID=168471 RepID=UPI001EFED791|nr:hypothetical protein [Laribacter hongkongensis]MCG9032691.1 hypothetical protein [Laribacter hongkongensis]MCG9093285.1 hypothetical protein [Laribacter hongkongensis]